MVDRKNFQGYEHIEIISFNLVIEILMVDRKSCEPNRINY